jgi:hypothetical protein
MAKINFIGTTNNSDDPNSSSVKQEVFYGSAIPRNCYLVTPNNALDLPIPGILYVTGAGDVKVAMVGEGEITLAVEDAKFVPIQVRKVFATGTNATGIYVFY